MSIVTVPELLALQSIRLAGVADEDAVLDRALIGEGKLQAAIAAAVTRGWIEHLEFADFGGWTITEDGRARLADLLAEELEAAGAGPVATAALAEFEVVNADFVARVGRWQLMDQGSAPDLGDFLGELARLGSGMRRSIGDLIAALPRFGRYPVQYDAAVERAGTEGLRWITGVGLLSAHVVWAELHQDLLSTLGRSRDAGV